MFGSKQSSAASHQSWDKAVEPDEVDKQSEEKRAVLSKRIFVYVKRQDYKGNRGNSLGGVLGGDNELR